MAARSKSAADPRRAGRWLIALAALLLLAAGLRDAGQARFDAWVAAADLPALIPAVGVEVLAADGSLLRAFQVGEGRWRLAPGAVDPLFIQMLIGWEDRRFMDHAGVDWRAGARAGFQALRAGRILSGASTLSMQVARLLEEGPTGTRAGKLRQIRLALALERRLTKDQILDLYLRLAPYGGNLEGVRAASLAWFGKEPRRLSPTEAALLVALPQSPEARRPDRHPKAAQAARNRVLARAADLGLIAAPDLPALLAEPVPRAMRAFPARAPLLAERLRRAHPGVTRIETTIDPRLQARAEWLAARAAGAGPQRLSAAIVVADHRDGAILASVGTGGWAQDARAGFVDMTRALRSPGSTLKPFVYALGFDDGLIDPETLIEDSPAIFGTWQPQNFDRNFRGTVTIRQALELSLNLPVVRVAEVVGPARLVQALARAGVRLEVQGGTPGLAVVLGGAGVSAEGLAQAYAALARGGQGIVLSAEPGGAQALARAMFGARAAWQVGDILIRTPPPPGAALGRLAYKTGTSYGNRDTWAVGYDGAHVGVVWLGRPDGTPVPGAFGADLAAPVLFELFGALPAVPLPPAPPGVVRRPNAALPPPLRRFVAPGSVSAAPEGRADPLRLTFPPDGARIELHGRPLVAKLRGGLPPYTLLVDGVPVVTRLSATEAALPALVPGFARVTVIDAKGDSQSVGLRID